MSVPIMDAWLDDDGIHTWIEHPCVDDELQRTMLPHPQWSVGERGRVTPSVHCTACGHHQFVNVTHGRWWLGDTR